jgi:hypothetical protein
MLTIGVIHEEARKWRGPVFEYANEAALRNVLGDERGRVTPVRRRAVLDGGNHEGAFSSRSGRRLAPAYEGAVAGHQRSGKSASRSEAGCVCTRTSTSVR